MHHRLFTRGLIALFLGVLSMPGFAQAGARQNDPAPRYTVTDLGAIKNYPSTVGLAINAKGVVVGQAYLPHLYAGRAAVYRSGKLRALIKGEKGHSAAQDINASGQIVGFAAEPDGVPQATLWESDETTDLGTLGAGSYALAINDAGVVVGWSYVTSGGDEHPFVWIDSVMTELDMLAGGERGIAFNVNAAGLVVGFSALTRGDPDEATPQHAVAWDDDTLIDLGTIAGDYSEAHGVNADGQIVGYSTTAADQTQYGPGTHAARWDGVEITDLGTLADGEISVAAAINAREEIVGSSTIAPGASTFVPGEYHAFLWRDGELLDLNDLVEGGSELVLESAYDINDKGVIVAAGTVDGIEHALLLKPIDA